MKIKIELSGGLDISFDKKKEFFVELSDQTSISAGNLIKQLGENYVKEKPEFFTIGETLLIFLFFSFN